MESSLRALRVALSLLQGKLFGKEVTFKRYQQSFGADYAFSGQVAKAHPLSAEESPEVWQVLARLRAMLLASHLKDHVYGACHWTCGLLLDCFCIAMTVFLLFNLLILILF